MNSIDPESSGLAYAESFAAQPQSCGREILASREYEHLEAERKNRQAILAGSAAAVLDLLGTKGDAKNTDKPRLSSLTVDSFLRSVGSLMHNKTLT